MVNAACLFRIEQTRCNISHGTNNAKLHGSKQFFRNQLLFPQYRPSRLFSYYLDECCHICLASSE